MFCIVWRRQSTPPSSSSIWPLTSPSTPPERSLSALQPTNADMSVENETSAIGLSSLDLKARHTAKIVVSSTEKSIRMSSKHKGPHKVIKRSLSFSYSSAKDMTKGLQRISRSASSSERLCSREDSAVPAMLAEVSCDNNVHRSSFVGDDNSHVSKSATSVKPLSLCSDLRTDNEKTQDRHTCNDSEKERDRTTAGLKRSSSTLECLTPGLAKVHLAHLATLKKCSNGLNKKKLIPSESEMKPFQPKQRLEVQALSSIPESDVTPLHDPPSRPFPHPKDTSVTIGDFLMKPSGNESGAQKRPLTMDGPSCPRTNTGEYDTLLCSLTPGYIASEHANMTLRESTVTPPAIQRSCQQSSCEDGEACSRTDRRESEVPLRSASPAHSPLEWSRRTVRKSLSTPPSVEDTSEDNTCAAEVPASASPHRRQHQVPPSTTPSAQPSLECSRMANRESPVGPSSPYPSKQSPSPFWPDSPLTFLSGLDEIPFLSNTPENSPVKQVKRFKSEQVSTAQAEGETVVPCEVSVDDDDIRSCLDECTSNPLYLREGSLISADIVDKGPKEYENAELYDNLETTDMDISESDLNNKDILHCLTSTASTEIIESPTSWNLNGNVQAMGREISKSSSLETVHVNSEVSKKEIPIADWQDNLEPIDMEISESLPCRIVLSQAYSCAPLGKSYDSSWSQVDNLTNTQGSVYTCDNEKRDSLTERVCNETSLASSSYTRSTQPLVKSISELSNPERAKEMDTITGSATYKAIEQTEVIPRTLPSKTEDVVVRDTRSLLVNSETTRVGADLKIFESRHIVKPVDMDIADDSELLCSIADDRQYSPTGNMELLQDDVIKSNEEDSGVSSSSFEEGKVDLNEQKDSETDEESFVKTKVSNARTDNPELKSSHRKLPYTILKYKYRTEVSQQEIQHSLSLVSSSNAQMETSSKEQKSSLSGTSTGLSPKVCIGRLKTLQDAFKTARNLNGCDTDVNTERSYEADAVKNTSLSPKLAVSPFITSDEDLHKDKLESSACKRIQHSVDSSTEDCKLPGVNTTDAEKHVPAFPKEADKCLGGVIEMSLMEDWGFQTSSNDPLEAHLRERRLFELDKEQDDDLDPIDVDEAVATSAACPVIEEFDVPEPEIVVCSPVFPLKTFTFRFPGKSEVDEQLSDTRTTEEEKYLVEERFRGVLPEVVSCSDEDSEMSKLSSEDLVSKACPPGEHSEGGGIKDEFDTSEPHGMVPQLVVCSDVDSEIVKLPSEDLVTEACSPGEDSKSVRSEDEFDASESCCHADSENVGLTSEDFASETCEPGEGSASVRSEDKFDTSESYCHADSEKVGLASEDFVSEACPPGKESESLRPEDELDASESCCHADSRKVGLTSEDLESKACQSREYSEGANLKDGWVISEFQGLELEVVSCSHADPELVVSSTKEVVLKFASDEKKLETSSLLDQSSKQLNKYQWDEECLGHLSRRLAPQCLEAVKEAPAILPEISEAPQSLTAKPEREEHLTGLPKDEKCCSKMSAAMKSVTVLESTSCVTERCPRNEEVCSFRVQGEERSIGEVKGEQLLDERQLADATETAKGSNCLVKVTCSVVEKEKKLNHGRAIEKRSEVIHLSCSAQCSVVMEGKVPLSEFACSAEENEKAIHERKERQKRKKAFNDLSSSTEEQGIKRQLEQATQIVLKTTGLDSVSEARIHPQQQSLNPCQAPKKVPIEIRSDNLTVKITGENNQFTDGSVTESKAVLLKPDSSSKPRKNCKSAEVIFRATAQCSVETTELAVKPTKKSKPVERTAMALGPLKGTEIRSGSYAKSAQSSVKPMELSSKAETNSKPGEMTFKVLESPQNDDVINRNYSKPEHSVKSLEGSDKTTRNNNLAEGSFKKVETVKSSESKGESYPNTRQSPVKTTEENAEVERNRNPVEKADQALEPLNIADTMNTSYGKSAQSSLKRTELTAKAERDTPGISEPLRGINHLHIDNRVHRMKRKRPSEGKWWVDEVIEKERKQQKMTPPPPLVPLERGLRIAHKMHETGHRVFRPYPGRGDYLFQQLHYKRERERLRYPCWASLHPPPFPVNSRGREILQQLIPDDPRWYPHDPRSNQHRFKQVCSRLPDRGNFTPVFTPCRVRPVLSPPPPLIPGPWPGSASHIPYPAFRSR